MANELTIDILLRYTKDSVARTFPRTTQTIDVAGENVIAAHKNIGGVAETLPVDEVGTGGWWVLANRSTTSGEDITIQTSGGTAMATLKPGEVMVARLSFAPDAISASGTPRLEYWGIDA